MLKNYRCILFHISYILYITRFDMKHFTYKTRSQTQKLRTHFLKTIFRFTDEKDVFSDREFFNKTRHEAFLDIEFVQRITIHHP